MTEEYVTEREFSAAMEPVQKDIATIKEAVEPIPVMVAQLERINGTVEELSMWRYLFIGGGTMVAFILGAGGITYILSEVI